MHHLLVLLLLAQSDQVVREETAPDFEFCSRLPPGVPDHRAWQKTWGEADFENEQLLVIQYEFYNRPGRSYEIVRARFIVPENDRGVPPRVSEHLFWVRFGGQGRYFELRTRRTWRKLWFGRAVSWQEFDPGSPGYIRQAGQLVSLFGLHRRLLFAEPDTK